MCTIKLREIKRNINEAADIKGVGEAFEDSSQQIYYAV